MSILCETLGPPVVRLEDGSVPASLQWHKNLALLVYLARSPKRSRARDHLIGLLWGDQRQEDARHSLSVRARELEPLDADAVLIGDADIWRRLQIYGSKPHRNQYDGSELPEKRFEFFHTTDSIHLPVPAD